MSVNIVVHNLFSYLTLFLHNTCENTSVAAAARYKSGHYSRGGGWLVRPWNLSRATDAPRKPVGWAQISNAFPT